MEAHVRARKEITSRKSAAISGCMGELTVILDRVRSGDPDASMALLTLVYDELRDLAAAKMAREAPGHTLQPTALVHEAWLRLGANEQPAWENRSHFFGAAAEAMRRILVDRARRRNRVRHGGGQERVDLDDLPIQAANSSDDERLLIVDESLDALAAEDPLKSEIVKLRFFVGLTAREVAEVLGVTERTVERHWAFARVWLLRFVQEQK